MSRTISTRLPRRSKASSRSASLRPKAPSNRNKGLLDPAAAVCEEDPSQEAFPLRAVAEALGIRGSLELPANRALGFYAMVGAATLGGGALAAININPIAMLFWTAVINGVIAVPIMLAMMVVVSSRNLNRKLKLHFGLKCLGWLGTALMTIAVAFLLVSSVV